MTVPQRHGHYGCIITSDHSSSLNHINTDELKLTRHKDINTDELKLTRHKDINTDELKLTRHKDINTDELKLTRHKDINTDELKLTRHKDMSLCLVNFNSSVFIWFMSSNLGLSNLLL